MPRDDILKYIRRSLQPDLTAGLTVAMVAIPQSMAYAAIAGVSPLFGLYAAIVAVSVGALFGSSPYLSSGPSNATAMATAGVLVAFASSDRYLEFVFALAVISGLIKLLLGIVRLGGIVRFVSNSVLTGFLIAAGVLININQLGILFGSPPPPGANAISALAHFIKNLSNINGYVLGIGIFSMLVLVISDRINQKIPSALVSIVLSTGLVALMGWQAQGVEVVNDLQSTRMAAISFHLPQVSLADLRQLLPGGFAVALLSIVEAMSIAKALALTAGKRIEPSRELVGQGLASIACGFFQGIPPSGSPTRSAVNLYSGAKTRWSGVFSGLFALIVMLLLRGWMGLIPIPSLAGVVIVSAVRIVNWRHVALTWKTRRISRLVLVVTCLATLVLPLQTAIYLGALLSILIYLYESSQLKISYLQRREDGEIIESGFEGFTRNNLQIALVNIDGPLYFAAVDVLEQQLEKLIETDVKIIILRMRHMQMLASSGITVLEGEIRRAQSKGIHVLACGVLEDARAILCSSGLRDLLGEENIFPANEVLLQSTRYALKRADEILAQIHQPSSGGGEERKGQ